MLPSINKTTTTGAKVSEELWRDSSVYTELMVSSYGRVKERSYRKVIPQKDGSFRIYDVPAKIIPPTVNTVSGDVQVCFESKGQFARENVDYLVATEFLKNENPTEYTRLTHIDGNKANVKASNLCWTRPGILANVK